MANSCIRLIKSTRVSTLFCDISNLYYKMSEQKLAVISLSEEQTEDVIAAANQDIYHLQTCMESLLDRPDWNVVLDLRSAIVVDYYVSAMWWAVKEVHFSTAQVSRFFSLIFNFLNDMYDGVPAEHFLIAIKDLSVGVADISLSKDVKMAEFSEVFSVTDIKQIVDYLNVSLLQHYQLYQVFFKYQEMCLTTDIQLEVQLLASKPVPPLCEAITEDQYIELIVCRKTSEEKVVGRHGIYLFQSMEVQQAKNTYEKDVIAKLSPDVVCRIVHEIFDEMVPTFQDEVKEGLILKQDALIGRINKLLFAKK